MYKFIRAIKLFLTLSFCILIFGCASTVNRGSSNAPGSASIKEETIQNIKFSALKNLTVNLNSEAQGKLSNNENFSKDKLYAQINSTLVDSQYLQTLNNNSSLTIEVMVTNLRVRSGAAAILMGFLAGADYITGQVYIKDGSKVLDNFEVDVSYALGGAMGDTDTRMSWLYESFANKILEELKKIMPKK